MEDVNQTLLFPRPCPEKGDYNTYGTIDPADFDIVSGYGGQVVEVSLKTLVSWLCNAKEIKCHGYRELKNIHGETTATLERTDYLYANGPFMSPLRQRYDGLEFSNFEAISGKYTYSPGEWDGWFDPEQRTSGTSIFYPAGLFWLSTECAFHLHYDKFYFMILSKSSNPDRFKLNITSVSDKTIKITDYYWGVLGQVTNHTYYTYTILKTFD